MLAISYFFSSNGCSSIQNPEILIYQVITNQLFRMQAEQSNPLTSTSNSSKGVYLDNNLYEFLTDIGPVTIQLICLPTYLWVVVSHAKKLNMDGSLQLAMQTPYEDKPTVVNIGVDQHQAGSNDLCRKLGKELGCTVVLSMNLEEEGELSIKDQRQLCKFIHRSYVAVKEVRQSSKQEENNNQTDRIQKEVSQ